MTAWRKASTCGANGTCVEVAETRTAVAVRDSTDPAGPVLTMTRATFAGLLAAIKEGR